MRRVIPALYRWMDGNRRFAHPVRLDEIAEPDLRVLAMAVETHYERAGPADGGVRVKLHRRMRWRRLRRAEGPVLPPLNAGEDRQQTNRLAARQACDAPGQCWTCPQGSSNGFARLAT